MEKNKTEIGYGSDMRLLMAAIHCRIYTTEPAEVNHTAYIYCDNECFAFDKTEKDTLL
jgi:hypothetical protein